MQKTHSTKDRHKVLTIEYINSKVSPKKKSSGKVKSKSSEVSVPIYCGDNVYIRPTYFIVKADYINSNSKYSSKQKDNEINLKENSTNGILSVKSSSKMRNALNWLVVAAKYKAVYSRRERKSFWFKTNFITLTIPPQISAIDYLPSLRLDIKELQQFKVKYQIYIPINFIPSVSSKQFQKCLNVFLTYSRKMPNIKLHNYLWKIEASKDGRLHIHFSTDIFYHYKDLRNCWNRILQREGLLSLHFSKYGNYDPNSTDVHSVYKVKSVSGYICGYLKKKPNLPKSFKGRIWGSSYSISSSNKCECYLDNDTEKRNIKFVDRPMIKYRAIHSKADSMGVSKQVASMYMLRESDWQTEMDGLIKDTYNDHRQRIRSETPLQPKEYLTIDFFGNRTKGNYEFINLAETKKQECEIESSTVRNGQIQLDLPL